MSCCSATTPKKPDCPPAEANWDIFTPLEQYKLVRAQIEHENTIIGHRITWFLTFQGFMFAALFAAFSAMDKVQSGALKPCALGIAVSMLCAFGFLSAFGCRLLVKTALAQHDAVVLWWNQKVEPRWGDSNNEESIKQAPYPPLYNSGPGGKNSPTEMHLMFCGIMVVWLILGICYWEALSGVQPLKCK